MGINVSRQTAALIAMVLIVAVGLLLPPARPKVAAAGPEAGIAAACSPGSRTGHADLNDNLQTSDQLTFAVRTPSDYDPTRAYPLLVVFPPARYNRRQSEAFYDLTTEATRRGFTIITALHIVLGELAPKSLALQRSEGTALWVVRPLGLFLFLLWPAIVTLNGLGNLLLRLCGLRPGAGEASLHSPEELKLLVAASQEGGLLNQAQQEVVERVFNIGDRRIADIMTPRLDLDWIDADDPHEEILRTIRECRHEQLLVSRDRVSIRM